MPLCVDMSFKKSFKTAMHLTEKYKTSSIWNMVTAKICLLMGIKPSTF